MIANEAHERQELASRQSRERIARLHLYLQGGPVPPTDADRLWVMEWFPHLDALLRVREETGGIPPSSEYHLERARRFIAGDLDALSDGCNGNPPESGSTPQRYDGCQSQENG